MKHNIAVPKFVKPTVADHQTAVVSLKPEQAESSIRKLQSESPPVEHSSIPAALAQFDELPDSAFVRLPVVLGLLGYSRSTLFRNVKSLRVASPRRLGNRISAWNVGELRQSLRAIEATGQTGGIDTSHIVCGSKVGGESHE